MRQFFVLLLLCRCWLNLTGQPAWDEQAFGSLTPTERFAFVHAYPFYKIADGKQLSTLLSQMAAIADAKKDHRTGLALKYYTCLASGNEGFVIPDGKTGGEIFTEMASEAKQQGYKVEEVVASYYLSEDLFFQKKLSNEQFYVAVQQHFEQFQHIGFEQFKDYNIAGMLFNLSKFLWDLGDFDKAFEYLTVAERFIEPTDEGGFHYTQILSYLQTYWKQRKDYDMSLAYAQKILQFHQNHRSDDPERQLWSRFWLNFSSIEIASLLIEQGKIAESEPYANKGLELSKTQNSLSPVVSQQAEFDALMVLIPTKLKLGKMADAYALLQRSLEIKASLEPQGQLDYFKPLKLYQHFSSYHELQGDPTAALRYARLAQTLQDSLDRRNDAHKLAQAQLRHEAERYSQRLELVESEKDLQKMLRNAVLVILALALALAFVNHRRLQNQRRQKEMELETAQNDLAMLTQNLKEKSELAENLRLEIEERLEQGNRSENLEQLINATILTEEDWVKFKTVFEKVHPGFMEAQKQKMPDLTNAEQRLLALDKLGLSTQEMANMLGVNKNTIHQTRRRLRLKMGEEGAISEASQ